MSGSNVASQQTPTELDAFTGHSLNGSGPPDADEWFYILPQLLSQFLRDHTEYPTSDREHDTDHYYDGISTHVHSRSAIRAQDLIQFLKHNAYTKLPSSIEQNGTPTSALPWMIRAMSVYQLLQSYARPTSDPLSSRNGHEIPGEQNSMLMYDPSSLVPVAPLWLFLQRRGDPEASPFESGHEDPAEELEDGYGSDAMSVSDFDTPTQSQDPDRVDSQPNEVTASILHGCPVCPQELCSVQGRHRHVKSHLPHSILCSFPDCTWTGRRQWDFKVHWRNKHLETSEVPAEGAIKLYDPRAHVNKILRGTPVHEVARSVFTEVQKSLGTLGKTVNVLGRSDDLRAWINIGAPSAFVSPSFSDQI